MIDMSFDYGNSLFIGLEIMTCKVDHDETLQNAASHRCLHCLCLFGHILIYSC